MIIALDPGNTERAKPRRLLSVAERESRLSAERRYREKNKDVLKERTKKYREKNREAIRARDRERYRADPDKYKKRSRERQARDPAGTRRSQWKYLYGITPEQFESLFSAQGRACAICRTPDFGTRAPHIDHCHETGKVRGILCDPCNRGLGTFGDDPARIDAAAEYLRKVRL